MNTSELKKAVLAGAFDPTFKTLYGEENISSAQIRYTNAIEAFESIYGAKEEAVLLSVPGRSEITGNHTDHNHGRVIAASVDCDVIAVAAKTADGTVRIKSDGYKEDAVSITALDPKNFPQFKSIGLVAGMCDAFKKNGLTIGGLCAYTTSNVLKGSGLSSSAAFEVMVGTSLNHLYNGGAVSPIDVARYAQWSENVYFGKPCGLMDQMACSVGSFVQIDFKDPAVPVINKVSFDFASCNHALCIVDTGGNHADLTDEYAAVRGEMEAVAAKFGKPVLRDVDFDDFRKNIPVIRESAGDRAVLRAMHFFEENKRVDLQAQALASNDFEAFKALIIDSGYSSYMYNQNIYTCKAPSDQPVSVALAICNRLLKDKGAWRVHGGGFAGTIQAFVPENMLDEFKSEICSVFGEKSCYVLNIRPVGGVKVID